ncbi:MAG: hypothetical protein WCY19_00270 [Candidatus Gastranaerophilaceae bacterium]
MNVTPVQNNNQASFGSVNLVQVSRKAFKNPEDLVAVSKQFNNATIKVTNEVNSKLGTVLSLCGLGKKFNKTVVYLEQPGYANIAEELKKIGGYSTSWLSRNTGIPIAEPLSQSHHSFTVLTKEQKDGASHLLFAKNIFALTKKVINEGLQKVSSGEKSKVEGTWAAARLNQLLSEQLNPILEGQPVHKFVIDDLSQLPKVFEQIEY